MSAISACSKTQRSPRGEKYGIDLLTSRYLCFRSGIANNGSESLFTSDEGYRDKGTYFPKLRVVNRIDALCLASASSVLSLVCPCVELSLAIFKETYHQRTMALPIWNCARISSQNISRQAGKTCRQDRSRAWIRTWTASMFSQKVDLVN